MKKIIYVLLTGLMGISLVACGTQKNTAITNLAVKNIQSNKQAVKKSDDKKENKIKENLNKDYHKQNKQDKDKKENKNENKINLYFSDDQAMYLKSENKDINDLTAQNVIDELKKGPDKNNKNLCETVPKDLDIKVNVKDKIAYINLPKDTNKKLNGGSSTEELFVYSIVNTLTLNKNLNIDKVRFLIDGKETKTINGHMDIEDYLTANKSLIK